MGALMNQTEAAEYLGKSRDKVREWVRLGVIPTWRDPESGRPMIPKLALDRWLAEQEAQAS